MKIFENRQRERYDMKNSELTYLEIQGKTFKEIQWRREERDRETDRQIDRQIDRQRGTDRQIEREIEKE